MTLTDPGGADKDDGANKPSGPRAAQYVRMSTEHQKYSTENQTEAISQYARQRGITIVRTYADEGKSGLRLDGRAALKRLIEDVRSGAADFSLILVYDISRWGRFQDADESAYYEFICKEAGISVRYCAEQFENDGSLTATVLKNIKRAMAGEYSRELSAKVFAGQCRLVALGFRQGGPAGFGLRRQLVDEQRHPKSILTRGQKKSLQTDRVVLVPGPPQEVETVRRIYRLFLEADRNEREIAGILNGEGRVTDFGRPWSRGTVHQVLTNEKYIGSNIYNRVSFKLRQRRVSNAQDMWIRAEDVFEPIVDRHRFEAAQTIIRLRSRHYSDEEMLQLLTSLFSTTGTLSGLIIDEQDDMPSSAAYRSRFGSLRRAYELVGFTPRRDYRYVETNKFLRALHPTIVQDMIAAIETHGGSVHMDEGNDLITINDEFTVSVTIARCQVTPAGSRRWKIRFDAGLRPDITIAVRMGDGNQSPMDFFIFPHIDIGNSSLRLTEDNGLMIDGYRFETLEAFFYLAGRRKVGLAA
jgi:DNA invertase Pin-like site-specific DNA recombinase